MDGGRARRGTFPPAIALPPPVCLTIRCGQPRYVPGYGGPVSREAFKCGVAGGLSELPPPGRTPSFRGAPGQRRSGERFVGEGGVQQGYVRLGRDNEKKKKI